MIKRLFHIIRIALVNSNRKAHIHVPWNNHLDRKSKILAYPGSNITLGDNVTLRSNPLGYHCGMPFSTTLLADTDGASIRIGSNTRVNGAYIHAKLKISIGNNCVIASGVNIIDSNGHMVISLDRTKGRDIPEPIVIGNNVWIATNAIVLKGVTIGDNSIVSAGSVVCRGDYPANCILQGNPAIVVKELRNQ